MVLQGWGQPWRLAGSRSHGFWGKPRSRGDPGAPALPSVPGSRPTASLRPGAQQGRGAPRVLTGGRTGRRSPDQLGLPALGVSKRPLFPAGEAAVGRTNAPGDEAGDTCLARRLLPSARSNSPPAMARPWQGASSTHHQSLFWDCFS